MIYLQYVLCTIAIVFAGVKLSRYGDTIAEKTGLSRTWVGIVMLATVTSLPELVTGISSVTVHNVPEIAVGDVLGSCLFNLLILVVLDSLIRDTPLTTRLNREHAFTASIGVGLLALVVFDIIAGERFNNGYISTFTPALAVIYFLAIWLSFRKEKEIGTQSLANESQTEFGGSITLRHALTLYAAFALVIVVAGSFLPAIADGIAQELNIHSGFVGTTFVALSTSLPELVVTLGAARMGAMDMAAGNVLGSNLFNMLVLFADDLFFRAGPLLTHVTPVHALTALVAIAMNAVLIAGLMYRARSKRFVVAWDSLALAALFTAGMFLSGLGDVSPGLAGL